MKTYTITYENGFETEIEALNIAEASYEAYKTLNKEVICIKKKEV